jgi:predicted nuclease with TOPRIM domain
MNKWLKGVMAVLLAGSVSLTGLPAWSQTVNQRQENQQRRIEQGVESGQITREEYNRLQRQQGRTQAMEDRMKADGKLTPKERAKLQERLDKTGSNVNRQKHDVQTKPPAY